VLQQQSSRLQPGLQLQKPGTISRRKLVIRASGAAGGLGGHGGGRGEPVSLQLGCAGHLQARESIMALSVKPWLCTQVSSSAVHCRCTQHISI
jgi:hypothetical protein